MHTVNIEEAAYVIFFHPQYEEAIVDDLNQNAYVKEDVKEKIQSYSLQLVASKDEHEQRCLEEQVAYLSNLLNALKKKEV